jgi:hypothetical protein
MKYLAIILLFIAKASFAQTPTVTWGEEFKLKKGSSDLTVIHTDNTGVYVKESHMALKSYFLIGATLRESASLIKLDKNLTEVYHNDFNKELRGKEFEQLYFIANKLYLIASDYDKRAKTLSLFGAEIDKNTGELGGEWQEITSWQKEEKNDDINFKINYNADSSAMVIVSSILGKVQNNFQIRQFSPQLKSNYASINITNEFDAKTFELEDVLYTTNGNVMVVAKIYEYEEGKKKKNKFLQFKNYNIRMYDKTGKQIKEINTDIADKWLVSTKVVQIPAKELILAAFYSNTKKGKEINGMLVQRINAQTGDVISTNQKEINTALITTLTDDTATADDDDEESKKEKKERESLEKIQKEEEGFSKYMRFRNIIYTQDKGLIILAEKYDSYTHTSTYYSSGGINGQGTWRTTTYQIYECGDLMMSKVDETGTIKWLQVLPKEQREIIQTGSTTGLIGTNNYFLNGFNFPFYAGFGVLPATNKINIFFNDNKKNVNVLQLGQKVQRIGTFRKTDCFAISLDVNTGKYTRTVLFSNNDVPTAMPRLGALLGNDFYLVGREDRIFGKTKIAIAKISLK